MIQWEQIRAKNQGKLANQIHERQDQKFTRCNISKPDIAKPNTAKPNTAKPNTAKSNSAKPDTVKPDFA